MANSKTIRAADGGYLLDASNGKVYESLIDNNAYSPSAYPAGWKEITE